MKDAEPEINPNEYVKMRSYDIESGWGWRIIDKYYFEDFEMIEQVYYQDVEFVISKSHTVKVYIRHDGYPFDDFPHFYIRIYHGNKVDECACLDWWSVLDLLGKFTGITKALDNAVFYENDKELVVRQLLQDDLEEEYNVREFMKNRDKEKHRKNNEES